MLTPLRLPIASTIPPVNNLDVTPMGCTQVIDDSTFEDTAREFEREEIPHDLRLEPSVPTALTVCQHEIWSRRHPLFDLSRVTPRPPNPNGNPRIWCVGTTHITGESPVTILLPYDN